MIADLLEPHQHRQDDALPLNATIPKLFARSSTPGRTAPFADATAAQRLDLGLVGRSAMIDLSVFIRRRM